MAADNPPFLQFWSIWSLNLKFWSIKVYGCGQPTLAGFGAALEKLTGKDKSAPVVWINMRQVIYSEQVILGQELYKEHQYESVTGVGASDAYEGRGVR